MAAEDATIIVVSCVEEGGSWQTIIAWWQRKIFI